jgi:hypothetical protein
MTMDCRSRVVKTGPFAAAAACLLMIATGSPAQQPLIAAKDKATEATATEIKGATVASFSRELSAAEAKKQKHPLYPVLEIAREAHARISKEVRDYTCTIVRRERIEGKLGNHEFIDAKIRHAQLAGDKVVEPFSVYLNFTKPSNLAGRQALYVEGENAGKVFVRRGGERMANLTTFIKPDSRLAMRENRYPITEIGFKNLVERLIEVVETDLNYDECEVQFFANAKVNERSCTRIEVVHPVARDYFKFHRAIVFVDDKDQLPIAYVSYTWPEKPGGKPVLLEEYVYTNIVLNPGLTDRDFDRDNPDYGFSRSDEADRP